MESCIGLKQDFGSWSTIYEDDYFNLRYFHKGSAHITFKSDEMTDRFNDVLIRHYGKRWPNLSRVGGVHKCA